MSANKAYKYTLIILTSFILSACGGSSATSDSIELIAKDATVSTPVVTIDEPSEALKINVPTLMVIMNWNDFSENDASFWHNKVFEKSENSVNRWYDENTLGDIQFTPIHESSGTQNDGVIIVNMNKLHPGDGSDVLFRDVEITQAITSSEVVDNVDFASFDLNKNGSLDAKELQIIFIVAGGEVSYGDSPVKSIWAHSWSYDSSSLLKVDGVFVMKFTGNPATSGNYSRFGANHGRHKATIGIMAHELGHSLLDLYDYYDDGGGSGLGIYDIMSGGSWAQSTLDKYPGDTPTQYSAYNKIDANLDLNLTSVNKSQNVTLQCSSKEFVKLLTSKTNEYFLLECRDTAKLNSDVSLTTVDSRFTDNRLFAILYHIDTNKRGNYEDGLQTSSHHYEVSLVEKNSRILMTSNPNVEASFTDVYVAGDVINSLQTRLYDGVQTGYVLEVTNQDYINRTMSVQITK